MITGQIIIYTSEKGLPNGCLECDGAAISRFTYNRLFNVIGIAHGVGDGSTTFNIPDLRGQFVRGRDKGAGNDPDAATRTGYNSGSSGDNVGSEQDFAQQKHKHTDAGHRHTYTRYSSIDGNPYFGPGWRSNSNINSGTGYANLGDPVNSGTGTPKVGNETRPTNISVRYCIKY